MRHLSRCVSVAALVAVAVMSGPVPAAAQTPHKSPIIEGSFGYAGFVNALAIGGSVRKRIKPRVSIGPEFLVVRGRSVDHYVASRPGPDPDPEYSADGFVAFDPVRIRPITTRRSSGRWQSW